ncbi:hypothetical protein CAEBREN_12087 [Caenorhabditis brenneri]|uniref:Uncharacterized protein n=1 Tax=Caenorhabditis brenneri TaxID=135651 RepID=G0PCV9_CAEBE|nr:hypothetical protein CAEBREN_12087 [Caenorhabditis brenneri]
MNPPTLLVIAARNVAEYILQGKYKGVDYELCDTGSNIIFDRVKELKYELDTEEQEQVADEILLKMVKPSKMNFETHRLREMREWDLEMLREQNLKELKMGDMSNLKDYVKEFDEETVKKLRRKQPVTARDYFDIIDLLNQNLKLETKTSLTKLDISKSHYDRLDNPFPENWTQAISQMLPNLKTLKIAGQNLPKAEFRVLCNSFPNLISLDIAATGLVDLTGIAKLQKLEELAMGGLPISSRKGLNDLYKLKNLKRLNLNEHRNFANKNNTVITHFARSDKSIPGLLEFDCSKSQIKQEELDEIVERHPTLKKIIANGVDFVEFYYEGIEISSSHSIDSLLRSIDYFYAKGDHSRNFKNVFQLADRIQNEQDPTIETLRPVIRKMYQLLPIYDYHRSITENIEMVYHAATRPDILPLYDDSDKRVLLEMFLILNVAHPPYTRVPSPLPWKTFNEIIQMTENPQTDKIAARAIQFFVAYEGKEVALECLDILDHLMEKIDMAAEEFKGLDIRKLVVGLNKIHTQKKWKKDIKQKAGRVMRFFEQFA